MPGCPPRLAPGTGRGSPALQEPVFTPSPTGRGSGVEVWNLSPCLNGQGPPQNLRFQPSPPRGRGWSHRVGPGEGLKQFTRTAGTARRAPTNRLVTRDLFPFNHLCMQPKLTQGRLTQRRKARRAAASPLRLRVLARSGGPLARDSLTYLAYKRKRPGSRGADGT